MIEYTGLFSLERTTRVQNLHQDSAHSGRAEIDKVGGMLMCR